MHEHETRDHTSPQAATDATLTWRQMLAQLYRSDQMLAHFIELLLHFEETNPEMAYCFAYLCCLSEPQRKTAAPWVRRIADAKRREAVAELPAPPSAPTEPTA